MILNEVFQKLKELGMVRSEGEFSRDWLGRSESYLRNIRFNGLSPSLSSVAVCASKLQHFGQQLLDEGMQKNLGEQLVSLAAKCHSHVNQHPKLHLLS